MIAQKQLPVASLLLALLLMASVIGAVIWRVSLLGLDEAIAQKRAAIKRLTVTQGIVPNDEVHAYLKERDAHLRQSYRRWLEQVIVGEIAEAAAADPQLFFQEYLHDVQRNLERLASARKVAPPEIVGLPKELPPTETVTRLLAQLELAQSVAGSVYEQGAIELSTIKIEDPEPVSSKEGRRVLLTRVPLRVRMSCTLAQLMRLMQTFGNSKPLIDVRGLRVISGTQVERIDVEFLLARYLATTQLDALLEEDAADPEKEENSKSKRSSKKKQPEAAADGG